MSTAADRRPKGSAARHRLRAERGSWPDAGSRPLEGRRSAARRSVLLEAANRRLDLAQLGEPANTMFGENQVSVRDDVEHTAGTLDEADGRLKITFEIGRQTGGPRVVVSGYAVGDGNVHGFLRLGGTIHRSWCSFHFASGTGRDVASDWSVCGRRASVDRSVASSVSTGCAACGW